MDENRRQGVIASLKENSGDIRRHLGNKLKNQLRRIPNLEFFLDETLDDVFRIEQLLKEEREKRPSSEDQE
jgi:ribosome-binding factor A